MFIFGNLQLPVCKTQKAHKYLIYLNKYSLFEDWHAACHLYCRRRAPGRSEGFAPAPRKGFQ
jgi:hypothetical protein